MDTFEYFQENNANHGKGTLINTQINFIDGWMSNNESFKINIIQIRNSQNGWIYIQKHPTNLVNQVILGSFSGIRVAMQLFRLILKDKTQNMEKVSGNIDIKMLYNCLHHCWGLFACFKNKVL